jgi:sortase A
MKWQVERRAGTLLLAALCLIGLGRIAMGAVVPVKAIVAQRLLEHAFDRSLRLRRPQKPWPWADMVPIARIRVPRLGVDRIVLDTGSGQAMAFGPTLLPGGMPLGEPGVAVLAAHRDTHFRFLEQLMPGDRIDAETVTGGRFRYRVTGSEVVRWDGFAVGANSGGSRLALSTCYPFGALRHGPMRYVVWAAADAF